MAAAGFSGAFELLMVVTTNHFLHSKKIPDEDRPRKLLRLSLGQLRFGQRLQKSNAPIAYCTKYGCIIASTVQVPLS